MSYRSATIHPIAVEVNGLNPRTDPTLVQLRPWWFEGTRMPLQNDDELSEFVQDLYTKGKALNKLDNTDIMVISDDVNTQDMLLRNEHISPLRINDGKVMTFYKGDLRRDRTIVDIHNFIGDQMFDHIYVEPGYNPVGREEVEDSDSFFTMIVRLFSHRFIDSTTGIVQFSFEPRILRMVVVNAAKLHKASVIVGYGNLQNISSCVAFGQQQQNQQATKIQFERALAAGLPHHLNDRTDEWFLNCRYLFLLDDVRYNSMTREEQQGLLIWRPSITNGHFNRKEHYNEEDARRGPGTRNTNRARMAGNDQVLACFQQNDIILRVRMREQMFNQHFLVGRGVIRVRYYDVGENFAIGRQNGEVLVEREFCLIGRQELDGLRRDRQEYVTLRRRLDADNPNPNEANLQEEIEGPPIGNQNVIAGAPNQAGLEVDRLQGRIADLERQCVERTQTLEGLQGQIADLERQREASTQVLDRLRREVDGELDGNPTQRKRQRTVMTGLTRNLMQVTQDNTQLTQENAELTQQNTELNNLIQFLSQETNESHETDETDETYQPDDE